MPHLVTNVRVYRAIAEEAASESKRLLDAGRTPKPDGSGFIVRLDPEQRSFKQSLIAIAFAGMYLEALLGLVGFEQLGKEGYSKIERLHWEVKLTKLGIAEADLIARCKRFREARNDLVHEKVLDLESPGSAPMRNGQEESAFAVEVVRDIAARFGHP